MIYFRIHESNEEPYDFVALPDADITRAPLYLRQIAYQVFWFRDGHTYYHKDRFGTAYQYDEEEQVVLKLKAVLL